MFDKCGVGVNIGRKIRFSSHVSLGNYSSIGYEAYISGELQVMDGVIIAPKYSFIAIEHIFSENNSTLHVGDRENAIIIEDKCWIAYRVTILSGVRIGEGSIVAASAVVTKDVPPFTVVGGVPAKVLKKR